MFHSLSLSSCALKRGSYARVVMATTSSTPLTYRTPTRCTPHHHHLTNTHTHTDTHTLALSKTLSNTHTRTVLNSARCAVPSTTSHANQRRETVRNVFESAREKRHLSQAKQLIINQITHTHTLRNLSNQAFSTLYKLNVLLLLLLLFTSMYADAKDANKRKN